MKLISQFLERAWQTCVACSVLALARHNVNKNVQKKDYILCSVEYLSTANAIKINTGVLVSKPNGTGRNCYKKKKKDYSVTRIFIPFVMTLIPTKCWSGNLSNHVCLGEYYSKRTEKQVVDWIQLTQDSLNVQAFVNKRTDICVPQSRSFFTKWTFASYAEGTFCRIHFYQCLMLALC